MRAWWIRNGPKLLPVAVALLGVLAVLKLADEFRRLVWESAPGTDAVTDLAFYHTSVHAWFSGEAIYSLARAPESPPASWVLLWPLVGWLPLTPARWLWAATAVLALG